MSAVNYVPPAATRRGRARTKGIVGYPTTLREQRTAAERRLVLSMGRSPRS